MNGCPLLYTPHEHTVLMHTSLTEWSIISFISVPHPCNPLHLPLPVLLLVSHSCHRHASWLQREYQQYRSYVIFRIPTLTHLDASPVGKEERANAVKRGEFCLVRRTTAAVRRSTAPASPASGETKEGGEGVNDTPSKTRDPTVFLGLEGATYNGADSEGNRFIGNSDL